MANRRTNCLRGAILFCIAVVASGLGFAKYNDARRGGAAANTKSTWLRNWGSLSEVSNLPLPTVFTTEQREICIVSGLRKRIRGRRDSFDDIVRVADVIGPIVREAVRQPSVQPVFARIARDTGVRLETAKQEWIALQEADILLESGGGGDSVSESNAVGVGQWLAGTARGAGLRVRLVDSVRLSGEIQELRRRLAWIEYLKQLTSDPRALGAPVLSPADIAAESKLRIRLEFLRNKRMEVDWRYDVRRSIFAQTRYLLGLYDRFPSMDWIFQAYHGGEAGVQHLLRAYLGEGWPGSATRAIAVGGGASPLSYQEVYFTVSPTSHRDAFLYLYSRGDDHRGYWWKLKASREAISAYRSDPRGFLKECRNYDPGQMTDVYWYPSEGDKSLRVLSDLDAVRAAGFVTPVPTGIDVATRSAPYDPRHAESYSVLRPEALGALRLVESEFCRFGGDGPLELGDMTLTVDYLEKRRKVQPKQPPHPPYWPPGYDPNGAERSPMPPTFDSHTIGLSFDLLRPADQVRRETLEYALGSLEDCGIIAVTDAKDQGERRFHVVPNPIYGEALAKLAR